MRRIILALFLIVFSGNVSAQERTKEQHRDHRDSLISKRNTRDTNFVRMYPDRFIFTLSASYRQFDIQFAQTIAEDTAGLGAPLLRGGTSTSYGGAIDFDKISFSFGLGAKEITDATLQKVGTTKYKAFNLSFCAYRFRVESNYRNLHGMYDSKTPYYDTSFHSTGIYFQNPSMNLRSLRVKTLFIFNKKHFSYNSAYYNTQRQLKTAGSLLLVNNIYNYKFTSDSSFIPPASRPFYGPFSDLNFLSVTSISLGPGYSFNLVIFKTLYFNATLTSGFDFQHRNYNSVDGTHLADYWHVGYAGDLRLALGLNGKRCFTSITGRWDTNNYIGQGIRVTPTYFAFDFNLGYRFPFKERSWVKKLKQNKWYRML